MQQPTFQNVYLAPAGARVEGEYALNLLAGRNMLCIFSRTTSKNIVRKILLLNKER